MARKLNKKEEKEDILLNIDTLGRLDSHADENHHPYEPTPYVVLERLVDEGYITEGNTLVDYGCGKGRVGLYLSKKTGCRSIGIEFNEDLYEKSMKNKESSGVDAAEFLCMNAEDYIPDGADSFFFFNPFSDKILNTVLSKIKDSYYTDPRYMSLFFYYPDDGYISLLMQDELISFYDEIDCTELFEKPDRRERILIFEILLPEEI